MMAFVAHLEKTTVNVGEWVNFRIGGEPLEKTIYIEQWGRKIGKRIPYRYCIKSDATNPGDIRVRWDHTRQARPPPGYPYYLRKRAEWQIGWVYALTMQPGKRVCELMRFSGFLMFTKPGTYKLHFLRREPYKIRAIRPIKPDESIEEYMKTRWVTLKRYRDRIFSTITVEVSGIPLGRRLTQEEAIIEQLGAVTRAGEPQQPQDLTPTEPDYYETPTDVEIPAEVPKPAITLGTLALVGLLLALALKKKRKS